MPGLIVDYPARWKAKVCPLKVRPLRGGVFRYNVDFNHTLAGSYERTVDKHPERIACIVDIGGQPGSGIVTHAVQYVCATRTKAGMALSVDITLSLARW